MKIAVAGATGRLGRHVAEVLTERGHQVVAISRATGVNIITGSGLEAALDGAEIIVDAAESPGRTGGDHRGRRAAGGEPGGAGQDARRPPRDAGHGPGRP